MTSLRNATAFAFTAAALVFAGQAYAQADAQVPHIAVTYGDLDLTSAEGRAKLQQRIAFQSDNACRAVIGVDSSLATQVQYTKCRKDLQQRGDARLAAILTGQKLAKR